MSEPTSDRVPTLEEQNPMTEADLIMSAWGLIANAGEGSWEREPDEWREAATRWRDGFHAWIDSDD